MLGSSARAARPNKINIIYFICIQEPNNVALLDGRQALRACRRLAAPLGLVTLFHMLPKDKIGVLWASAPTLLHFIVQI